MKFFLNIIFLMKLTFAGEAGDFVAWQGRQFMSACQSYFLSLLDAIKLFVMLFCYLMVAF